jgi:hypothetical protein
MVVSLPALLFAFSHRLTPYGLETPCTLNANCCGCFTVVVQTAIGGVFLFLSALQMGMLLPFRTYENVFAGCNPCVKLLLIPVYLATTFVLATTLSFIGVTCLLFAYVFSFIIAILIGWPVFIGTLGLPLCIAHVVAPNVTEQIQSFRKYNVGDRFIFDGLLTFMFLFPVLLIGLIAISTKIMVMMFPATVYSVSSNHDLLHSVALGTAWVVLKCVQFAVSICLPLLKLYALGELYRLKKLIGEYPNLILLIFFVEKLELLIDMMGKTTGTSDVDMDNVRAKLAELQKRLISMSHSMQAEMEEIAESLFDYDFKRDDGGSRLTTKLLPHH